MQVPFLAKTPSWPFATRTSQYQHEERSIGSDKPGKCLCASMRHDSETILGVEGRASVVQRVEMRVNLSAIDDDVVMEEFGR